jgi:hypothetical protein
MVFLSVLMAAFFPRFALFLIWILRPGRVDAAFDTFILPLLGIVFLPFATLMYVLLHTPGVGLSGWEWFWVVVCAFYDLAHLGVGYMQQTSRSAQRQQPVVPSPSRMA